MAWYHRVPAPKLPPEQRKSRMEGLWIKCDGCGEIIYKQDVEKNLEVCPKCDEHFPLPVRKRLELVLDPGTFVEHDIGLESTDPLQFSDSKKYKDRIKASQKSAAEGEALEVARTICELLSGESPFAVSTVVNRRPHEGHCRRRRIEVPSSVARESTTRESSCRQNGQCTRGLRRVGRAVGGLRGAGPGDGPGDRAVGRGGRAVDRGPQSVDESQGCNY